MTENEPSMIGGEILELKVANMTYLVDMSNEQLKHKHDQSQEDVSGTRVHIHIFRIVTTGSRRPWTRLALTTRAPRNTPCPQSDGLERRSSRHRCLKWNPQKMGLQGG